MIQQERVTIRLAEEHPSRPVPWTRKLVWTLGNLLMLCGLCMLLYVGGVLADEQYNIYCASGSSDIDCSTVSVAAPAPTPAPTAAPVVAAVPSPTPAASIVPTPSPAAATTPDDTANASSDWSMPQLNTGGSAAPAAPAPSFWNAEPSTVTRIIIPKLDNLDKKVVEVAFSIQDNIQQWAVDLYRVGHHQGTSNPGGGGNIVLSGHSGGTAYPFNDLYYLQPGDAVQLYSGDQLYNYTVTENILVDEVGQPPEKRTENAQYILPTAKEMVTMVTCWPLIDVTTEDGQFIEKFSQRVIVRAEPIAPAENVAQGSTPLDTANGWVAR